MFSRRKTCEVALRSVCLCLCGACYIRFAVGMFVPARAIYVNPYITYLHVAKRSCLAGRLFEVCWEFLNIDFARDHHRPAAFSSTWSTERSEIPFREPTVGVGVRRQRHD